MLTVNSTAPAVLSPLSGSFPAGTWAPSLASTRPTPSPRCESVMLSTSRILSWPRFRTCSGTRTVPFEPAAFCAQSCSPSSWLLSGSSRVPGSRRRRGRGYRPESRLPTSHATPTSDFSPQLPFFLGEPTCICFWGWRNLFDINEDSILAGQQKSTDLPHIAAPLPSQDGELGSFLPPLTAYGAQWSEPEPGKLEDGILYGHL